VTVQRSTTDKPIGVGVHPEAGWAALLAESELRAPIMTILFKRAKLVGISVRHKRALEEAFAHLERGAAWRVRPDSPKPRAHERDVFLLRVSPRAFTNARISLVAA
jgi:hypothetical protein